MSADQLAAVVTALGLRYTRAQVTNLEAGRRDGITVGELIAFGQVLNVPPIVLMFPVGHVGEVELVPDRHVSTWDALRWFVGEERPTPFSRDETITAGPLCQYRQHRDLLKRLREVEGRDVKYLVSLFRPDATDAERAAGKQLVEAEDKLRSALRERVMDLREQMRSRGLVLPPLPFVDTEV